MLEKFAETLGFYNSVVGESQLLVLTSKLRIGVGLEGVLNNGSSDFIPDINRIKQPGNGILYRIKSEQAAECTKNRIDIAAGNRVFGGGCKKLRLCRIVKRLDPSNTAKTRIRNTLCFFIFFILFRKFAFNDVIKFHQFRELLGQRFIKRKFKYLFVALKYLSLAGIALHWRRIVIRVFVDIKAYIIRGK